MGGKGRTKWWNMEKGGRHRWLERKTVLNI